MPALRKADGTKRPRVSWNVQAHIGLLLLVNLLFFSIAGGAVLARYLLPLYPFIFLLCVSTWRRRVEQWPWIVALSTVAFLAGLFVNPPYRFTPEDNLTYRSLIIMQQQAISQVIHRAPGGTVLTAWPATDELRRPELGYVRKPVHVVAIDNFSLPQIETASSSTTTMRPWSLRPSMNCPTASDGRTSATSSGIRNILATITTCLPR